MTKPTGGIYVLADPDAGHVSFVGRSRCRWRVEAGTESFPRWATHGRRVSSDGTTTRSLGILMEQRHSIVTARSASTELSAWGVGSFENDDASTGFGASRTTPTATSSCGKRSSTGGSGRRPRVPDPRPGSSVHRGGDTGHGSACRPGRSPARGGSAVDWRRSRVLTSEDLGVQAPPDPPRIHGRHDRGWAPRTHTAARLER